MMMTTGKIVGISGTGKKEVKHSMKKPYVKPGRYVENFSLAQSIAAGCGASHDSTLGGPNVSTKNTCGWEVSGAVIWPAGNVCSIFYDTEADVGGVCYNNPNGGATIFAS